MVGHFNFLYDLAFGIGLDQCPRKAPEEITSGKHRGKKTKAEIDVVENEHVGRPEDVDFDINITSADDAMSDLTELEAFAKKKTVKQIHKYKQK